MIVPSIIFIVAIVALLQFFVLYCRSLIAASRQVELSRPTRELAGIQDNTVRGEQFGSLVQLVRMCPELSDEGSAISAVRAYFGLVQFAHAVAGPISSSLSSWTARERDNCAYYAAVALDRRISRNRDLFDQQRSGQL